MNGNDNSGFSFTNTVFFFLFSLSTHDFDEITIWFFYEFTDRSLTNDTISNNTRYIFHDRSEKKILWYLLVSKVSRLTVICYFTGVSFFCFYYFSSFILWQVSRNNTIHFKNSTKSRKSESTCLIVDLGVAIINNHAKEISKLNVIVIFIVISTYLPPLNILGEVILLFVGDISFAGPIKYYVDKYHTYNDTFNDVAPFIREADISVGNLESPFANQHVLNHLYRGRKSVLLYAIPKAASALRWKS